MSAAQSGWHQSAIRQQELSFKLEFDGPTLWELLLRDLDVAEGNALTVLQTRGDLRGEKLRRFARLHCTRRFVPEDVLAFLGLDERAENSYGLSWAYLRNESEDAA